MRPKIKVIWFSITKGPIRHKPWPIQTVSDRNDSSRMSRQLQTVKTGGDYKDNCRLLQTVERNSFEAGLKIKISPPTQNKTTDK